MTGGLRANYIRGATSKTGRAVHRRRAHPAEDEAEQASREWAMHRRITLLETQVAEQYETARGDGGCPDIHQVRSRRPIRM
jgi:hypothetical protein